MKQIAKGMTYSAAGGVGQKVVFESAMARQHFAWKEEYLSSLDCFLFLLRGILAR